MPCVKGCCDSQAEHYRSLRLSNDRKGLTKVTTDEHDGGQTVDVTQHWHDRQDVMVKPATLKGRLG